MRNPFIEIACAALLGLSFSALADTPTYTLTDLDTAQLLPFQGLPVFINDEGQVAGSYFALHQ